MSARWWGERAWIGESLAVVKDRLETVLCDLVCDGLLDIGNAQEAIITDWIAAYHLYNE